jgi:hypothetical protein
MPASCASDTFRAMQILEDLRDDFEIASAADGADDKQPAFFERLAAFCTYIGRNGEQILNYGERHRCGEPMSTPPPRPPSTRSSAAAWSSSSRCLTSHGFLDTMSPELPGGHRLQGGRGDRGSSARSSLAFSRRTTGH